MKIDSKAPIAGLRPAVLKRLFRRRDFTPSMFAKATGIPPKEAAAKLNELADLGWVIPKSPQWWTTTELGDRLSATPLIPPIRVTRARGLLENAVAAAVAINADPTHSYVVLRLVLFGSLLDAPLDGWVGDVDLAFELGRRDLAPGEKEWVWNAELATAPPSLRGIGRLFWPSDRAQRRLKVDRSISLHAMDELAGLGLVGHVVYDDEKITLPW